MRIRLLIISALVLIAFPAFADVIGGAGNGGKTLNATSYWYSRTYGAYSGSGAVGYQFTQTSGSTGSQATWLLDISFAPLPTGAQINSATLTYGVSSSVMDSWTSLNYFGYIDQGYSYSYSCGFFHTCGGYYYFPYSAGSIAAQAASSGWVDTLFVGNAQVYLGDSAGTIDLLSAGFGGELGGVDHITLGGFANLNNNVAITNYGFNDYSGYTASATGYTAYSGSVRIDYTIPDPPSDRITPTPEPAGIALVAVGLVVVLRRRNR